MFERETLKRIRVMVVDDSLQFASAVGQFLACSGNFEVLACANSGGEALARFIELQQGIAAVGRIIDLKREGLDARKHRLFHAA